jgi:hypothetical protein
MTRIQQTLILNIDKYYQAQINLKKASKAAVLRLIFLRYRDCSATKLH